MVHVTMHVGIVGLAGAQQGQFELFDHYEGIAISLLPEIAQFVNRTYGAIKNDEIIPVEPGELLAAEWDEMDAVEFIIVGELPGEDLNEEIARDSDGDSAGDISEEEAPEEHPAPARAGQGNGIGLSNGFHHFQGEQDAYLEAFGKYKSEMNVKNPSIELVGSWTCSYGRTRDQAIHLWRHNKGYEDVDSSIALHGKDAGIRAADNDVARLCGRRKNLIVKSFSYWREPEQRPPNHVYDLRSYVLQPGTMIDWASAWAKGIQYRRAANQDVGGFFAQVGQLYVVYHIWAYPSMSDRNDTRHATWAKPAWDATVANTVPLIKKMQSKILTPTRYSQLE